MTDKKDYMRNYMREYMRKRRAEDPDYNKKSQERCVRRKFAQFLNDMSIGELEAIIEQKRAATEG